MSSQNSVILLKMDRSLRTAEGIKEVNHPVTHLTVLEIHPEDKAKASSIQNLFMEPESENTSGLSRVKRMASKAETLMANAQSLQPK
jgi:hypothetical protein